MKCNNCGVDVGLTAAQLNQEPAPPTEFSDEFVAAAEAEMNATLSRMRAEFAARYFAADKPRQV